ncbi:MAG: PKD domain-containing protein [Thermoplasmata archaeon]|nr:PKD domain-containing protein [Thermoplasmata archaeon]
MPVGPSPDAAVVDLVHHLVFVAGLSNVSVLAGTASIASFNAQLGTGGFAADPANGYVYAPQVTSGNGSVDVFNGTSYVGEIPLPGSTGLGAAFNPSNGYVYVPTTPVGGANGAPGNVSVINGTAVIATVQLLGQPGSNIAVDSKNGYVYVSTCLGICNTVDAEISVISGTSLIATPQVGVQPGRIGFDLQNGYTYVPNALSDNTTVLNGTEVLASIPVGRTPTEADYDPVNGLVYVINLAFDISWGTVSVIRGLSVVGTVGVGLGPEGGVVDSRNGYFYVTNSEFGTDASVISNTTSVTNITVGLSPVGGVFDPQNGYVYILNRDAGTVSVIDGSFAYPIIGGFRASPPVVELGSAINSSTSFVVSTGGQIGLTFYYSHLPPGCTTTNTDALPCTPVLAGTYEVSVELTNSAGFATTSETKFTVLAALVSTVAADPNPGDAESPIGLFSTPSGGTGVYTFAWEFADGSSGLGQNPSHIYRQPGRYVAKAWVNDSEGGSASRVLNITVDPPLKVSFGSSSGFPVLDQSITLHAVVTGGASPFSYMYEGLPPGCVSINSSTITCQPTQVGTYRVTVVVTDANGVSVESSTSLRPQSISQILASPPVLLAFTVTIALVVLAVLLVRRRARNRVRNAPLPPDGAPTTPGADAEAPPPP